MAWRSLLALSVAGLALLGARVSPALRDRWRGPAPRAATAAQLDLCASRRPDGVLPHGCGDQREVTLLFGGDTAEADAALPVLAERGFDFPFQATLAAIQEADVAVVNLEAPITDDARTAAVAAKQYVYRAPGESALALARAGIDVASLANNHAFDLGAEGVAATTSLLASQGVVALGAGADEATARRALVVRVGGVRIGMLARCERKADWDLWVHQYAARAHAGVAALDAGSLAGDVAELRPLVDVVVLLVHWGDSYGPISRAQEALAARAAAAGVDLIVGHHPHLAQPVGLVRGAAGATVPVAYSLGNYAFGTAGRPDLEVGLLLRARLRVGRLVRLELVPLDVQNRRVGYRPELLHGPAAAAALAPLVAASQRLGLALRGEGDAAVVDLDRPAAPGGRDGAGR